MKDIKRKFTFVSNLALIVLIILIFVAGVTNVVIKMWGSLQTLGFPGTLSMLFDYSRYASNHDARFIGQIISNSIAYLFMLAAIVIFILSLVLVKHDKVAKAKCAIIALFILVPATLGLAGGIVNFFGEGLQTILGIGGSNAAIVLVGVIVTFVLDVVYLVLAIVSLSIGLKTAVKVNKGEIKPEPEYEPAHQETLEERVAREAKEADDHKKLLEDIRQIVREELERLDRVVIAKEAPVVYQSAPVTAPVAEEEEEEKRKGAPRIPFAKKMVKADKDLQDKYSEIKNEILAYEAKSRVSIAGDTFRLHRKQYVKITLVGKTLKLYFALNPRDFADSPIPVIDASDKVAYEEVPALLKVKSNLSVKRAKELVRLAFEADGIKKEKEPEDHNWMKEIRQEARGK